MRALLICILIFAGFTADRNEITSGEYNDLKIAFNAETKTITGFFEEYSGEDEKTKQPLFSCVFYFEGRLVNNKAEIKSYFPLDKKDDLIEGTLRFENEKVFLQLNKEHGGCWNVQHFADEEVKFALTKKHDWLEIRFVEADKGYLYRNKNDNGINRSSYLKKGDIVSIDKIDNDWLRCTYLCQYPITGWIKSESLNQISN